MLSTNQLINSLPPEVQDATMHLLFHGYTITREDTKGTYLISPSGYPCGWYSDWEIVQLHQHGRRPVVAS